MKRKIGLKKWLRSEKNRKAVRICGLAGCPEGGWGETEQAKLRIRDMLPNRDERSFTVDDVIDAMYRVNCPDPNAAGRYELRED